MTTQPTTVWRHSSRCNSGYCVEVAHVDGHIRVRDSKLGDTSPHLVFTPAQWGAFLALAKGCR